LKKIDNVAIFKSKHCPKRPNPFLSFPNHITMPFKPLPSKIKKPAKPSKPESDSESSLDERGNVKHLIDYDYEESSETTPTSLPSRKAKKLARRKIRKAIEAGAADTASSASDEKPTIVVEEIQVVTPKKRTTPVTTDAPKKAAPKHVVEESESETESEPPTPKKSRRRRAARKYETESEESELSETESEPPTPKKSRRVRRRKYETESEEESEDETEEESDEEDDEDYDSEDEDEEAAPRGRISLMELLGGDVDDPRKPKKYNLKKEPAVVRRFVELVNHEEEEEDNIDNDITYFKSLTTERQMALLKVLELKAAPPEVQTPLKFKILEKVAHNPELARIAMAKYTALMNIDPSSTEYYKCSHWINGFTGLPLGTYRDLPVKLEDGAEKCQAFMETVHKSMEEAIFGHQEAKLQILQFVSSWIANPKAHGNVLSIHGPPGVGKTTLIKDGVAKALGRPFHFITLGGATDAAFLDGHSYTYEGSTWGKIADVLIQSKCMNPVIYFDELDKVSDTPKGDEIMNMLIHITDGSQNDRFQDKYFTGINLDLSRCLFIFSHNNHEKVNPILRDRMYNIAVKGFNTQEKLQIVDRYILQPALQNVGLFEKVSINKDIVRYIIEHFTGEEEGVRELKRCIQTLVSKINLLRFFNNPKQIPFAITDFQLPFTVKQSHVDLFIKRKPAVDPSISHMYT
jgi:flagellar biosynthesis GTPase FlhF